MRLSEESGRGHSLRLTELRRWLLSAEIGNIIWLQLTIQRSVGDCRGCVFFLVTAFPLLVTRSTAVTCVG